MRAISLTVVAALLVPFTLRGQSQLAPVTLHTFSALEGYNPSGGIILGTDGNLYGVTNGIAASTTTTTTVTSGATTTGSTTSTSASETHNLYGAVFQVNPTMPPSDNYSPVFTFVGTFDGSTPLGNLIEGGTPGVFYGTTSSGGVYGDGTVFRVTQGQSYQILHSFGAGDGTAPASGLAGGSGILYGTTPTGLGSGTIYQIGIGGAYSVVYIFSGGTDGAMPTGALTQVENSFYGTTSGGGAYKYGTIFRFTPPSSFETLYSFTGGSDGATPTTALTRPGDGFLFGTTSAGGQGGLGTVFKITADGTFKVLYYFTDTGVTTGPLLAGDDGYLYGTTSVGGAEGFGVLFRVSTTANASSDAAVLYSFPDTTPVGSLIESSDGVFYGATTGAATTNDDGGFLIIDGDGNTSSTDTTVTSSGVGTVFELKLYSPFFDGQQMLSNGVYYLAFPNGTPFGYYSFLANPSYIYHYDLGYEYVIDAGDGSSGVYLYDFASGDYFYTSPSFPFPYLYDLTRRTPLYYFPNTSDPGHYTSNPRYFYDYSTGQIITM